MVHTEYGDSLGYVEIRVSPSILFFQFKIIKINKDRLGHWADTAVIWAGREMGTAAVGEKKIQAGMKIGRWLPTRKKLWAGRRMETAADREEDSSGEEDGDRSYRRARRYMRWHSRYLLFCCAQAAEAKGGRMRRGTDGGADLV